MRGQFASVAAEQDMRTALLVVDVLGDFQHEDGDRLAESFRRVCGRLAEVIEDGRRSAVAVIYANDPAGRWNESRAEAVERARMGAVGDLMDQVAPTPDDLFIVKPRYSAFDHTPLEIILDDLGIEHVLLVGTATEMCVAQTAIDARELGLKVTVVREACASVDPRDAETALEYLANVVGVRVSDRELSGAGL
jgi:nicotinamidase-related amidase